MVTGDQLVLKITHILQYFKDAEYRFAVNDTHGLYRHLDDKTYLKKKYYLRFGKRLDIENPHTFNEKLQWLKIHDHNPLYSRMVDKVEAKTIAAELIGKQHIIPTLGVWARFDEIDFESLPNQFVLKCTHDSGGVVICKDKNNFDLQNARIKIEKALSTNYFWRGREWPYKNVKPKIIAESYLHKDNDSSLNDYKFMCFNGIVKCCFVCSERFSTKGLHVTFFDNEWKMMPFTRHYPRSETMIPKPVCFTEMIALAERMSKDIPFVRIDMYEVDGVVFFGEFTFFPGSGLEEFSPEEWDTIMGNWLILPNSQHDN